MVIIQPSFTSSKWNMGEIFGLTFHLSCVDTPIFFIEIPFAEIRSFLLMNLSFRAKNPPFYEVNE